MKLRLNISTSPIETHRRFILGSALVGTIAVGLLVWLSWSAYRSWRADSAFRADRARLERRLTGLQAERRTLESYFSQPDILKVRDRSGFLNGLIEQRSFPWTKLFTDLEGLLPTGVRVVSIEPKMNAGRVEVKLTFGANDDQAKLKFLHALEDSKDFSRIQLMSETRSTRPEEAGRVVVELVAWYVTT